VQNPSVSISGRLASKRKELANGLLWQRPLISLTVRLATGHLLPRSIRKKPDRMSTYSRASLQPHLKRRQRKGTLTPAAGNITRY
jgi:hypothetical protein